MRYYNPCLSCDCYDPDIGCTMPSIDRNYACPLFDDEELERYYHTELEVHTE